MDLRQHGFQRCSVSGLGGNASEFKLRREIFRLSRQNLLNQSLIFCVAVGVRLAFHFFGKLISGAIVARIEFNRPCASRR